MYHYKRLEYLFYNRSYSAHWITDFTEQIWELSKKFVYLVSFPISEFKILRPKYFFHFIYTDFDRLHNFLSLRTTYLYAAHSSASIFFCFYISFTMHITLRRRCWICLISLSSVFLSLFTEQTKSICWFSVYSLPLLSSFSLWKKYFN